MRFATYVRPGASTPCTGVLIDERLLDLSAANGPSRSSLAAGSLRALLAGGERSLDAVRSTIERVRADAGAFADALTPLAAVKLLPPIPDASKFLCVGKNYRSHLDELKRGDLIRELPQEPTDRKSTRLNSSHLGISYA